MNRKERRKLEKRRKAKARAAQQSAVFTEYAGSPNGDIPDGRSLLGTTTGETFQPVRVYYQVKKPKMLRAVFRKLRCLEHDPERHRWVWLYTAEAKKIRLKTHPDIAGGQAIVLGSFHMPDTRTLYVDLRSIERLLAAIPFFDRALSRKAAALSHASLLNRVFDVKEGAHFSFDDYFETALDFEDPSEKMMQDLEAISHQARNEEEKMQLLDSFMAEREQTPLEDVEDIPIRYYEEGIEPLKLLLMMRQRIAVQHWLGNTEYTKADFIRELAQQQIDKKES